MAIVPWLKKKTDKEQFKDQRSQNSEEENKLLDFAHERWDIALSSKVDNQGRPLHSKWKEYDQIYRGQQWSGEVPEGKSTPVLNLIQSMIQSVLPRITDTYPEFLILPRRSASDKSLAEKLSAGQEHLWYVNKMQQEKLAEAALYALKYGTSIFKVTWNPDLWRGMGDIIYNVVHPMNFFPDPRSYHIEDMDYCFTAVPKSLEYFSRRWADKGHLVVADHDWYDTENLEGRNQSSQEQVATLKEYWFRDEEGNMCVMYYAGHLVLDVIGGIYDDNNPVYRHNKFPFAKFVDYHGDKEFWGFGEIELADTLQRLINSFEAQIIDNTRLMANAQWLVEKSISGLTEEDAWIFDNNPGQVIWTHTGGVKRIEGMPIPAHIPQHQERLIFMMEQILGIHDVVQGRQPSGVRAASAIIALQEAANIRVRQKTKHLGAALQELVEQSNYLMLEFYDEPRQIRLAGQEEPTTLDVREHLNPIMLEQGFEAGMLQFDDSGGLMPGEEERIYEEVEFPEFDVEVKIGPSVPYSQALLYEQAKEFFMIGLIDRQAALEAVNFPNKEAIIERMEQTDLAAMQERVGERTYGGTQAQEQDLMNMQNEVMGF